MIITFIFGAILIFAYVSFALVRLIEEISYRSYRRNKEKNHSNHHYDPEREAAKKPANMIPITKFQAKEDE